MIHVQFDSGKEIVRGFVHYPTNMHGSVPGILILPGFADTAVGPHNLHVCMARALSQAGYVVLRFDYRGQGESDGDFRQFTGISGLDDAYAALDALCRQPAVDASRLGVVGFSLGGALACEMAARIPSILALVLLAPVAFPQVVFRTFFTDEHLKQADQQGWMDWLGWAVGNSYLPSLSSLHPLAALAHSRTATLVLHGTNDREVPIKNAEAYEACGATLQRLDGGDHQFASVFLQEEAIHNAKTWFQKRFTNFSSNQPTVIAQF